MESKICALETEKMDMQSHIRSAEAEKRQLESRVAALEEEKTGLTERISFIEEEKRTLQSNSASNSDADNLAEQKERELQRLGTALGRQTAEVERLRRELDSQVRSLQQQLDEKQLLIESL